MLTIIEEFVDIYQMPDFDQAKSSKGAWITMGDLHGNTMKLIFMLFKHGIASGISKAEYNELVRIYRLQPDKVKAEDLLSFTNILCSIHYDNSINIRLIGDELADRGSNDYFTLHLLEQLQLHNINFEIIISNHSIEFLQACERQSNFHAPLLHYEHARSMEHLQSLIDKGLVSRDKILSLTNSAYKPNLKALAYYLNSNKSEITIFTHAGIGLKELINLAVILQLSYADETAADLAQTIDTINQKFQELVHQGAVSSLYQQAEILDGYSGWQVANPFVFMLWNRLYDNLLRPMKHKEYQLNFVHGHDSNESTRANIFNLDNMLGKADRYHEGDYLVLYID
ncbi:MAG: Dot/Icm T4SS effector Wip [Legionella sp.]